MPLIPAVTFDKPAFRVNAAPWRHFSLKIFHNNPPCHPGGSNRNEKRAFQSLILMRVCEFGAGSLDESCKERGARDGKHTGNCYGETAHRPLNLAHFHGLCRPDGMC